MVQQLDQWIAEVGWVAYLVLGVSAMIEYIFPPFPGDTVTLLGGVYAARGQKPWQLVLAVLTVGSMLGAMVDYRLGTRLERWLRRQPPDRRFLGFTRAEVERAEARMRKRGDLLILLNRFLVGIRGPLFFAAGVAGMPAGRVLALGTLSSLVFNVVLLGVGFAAGGNAERLEQLARRYQEAVYLLLGVVALVMLLRFLWGRRGAGSTGEDRNERR
jgi:membrane protein DedA with SNARE-associated domain